VLQDLGADALIDGGQEQGVGPLVGLRDADRGHVAAAIGRGGHLLHVRHSRATIWKDGLRLLERARAILLFFSDVRTRRGAKERRGPSARGDGGTSADGGVAGDEEEKAGADERSAIVSLAMCEEEGCARSSRRGESN